MAASQRTINTYEKAKGLFGDIKFDKEQYNKMMNAHCDFNFVTLETLRNNNLIISIFTPKIVNTFTFEEFVEMVNDSMVGEDCYGMTTYFEIDKASGQVYELRESYTYRFV